MSPDAAVRDRERRLLVLAPFGRDAELIARALRADGVTSAACPSIATLASEAERGAAALLLGEEALGPGVERLASLIAAQPPWSDLPVLVMTRHGADSPVVARSLETLGNVTLIERPVRVAALRSAVRTALRARERQYQARADLRERDEANQRKDEFLATLAHELRNPLAPIRNAVSVLRLGSSPEAATQLFQMMERQVAHMVRLVDDLIEVSRITRGKFELHRQRVTLQEVIDAALETSRPLIEAERHTLVVNLPAEPLPLDADATRLSQVFANLLNNAAKYTPAPGRITVAGRQVGGEVEVKISDTGVGIPADELPKVFDLFMQGAGNARPAQVGLGIGLTLARNLVEMHGGTIAAASEGPGHGSEFTVRLPLARGVAAPAARSERPTPPVERRRVLVVDDNRDAADSLGALLEMLGAEARVLHTGAAALEALDGYRPELALLDLGMPEMDGYELARRIRALPGGERIRLIALTGWSQERDRRRTHDAGFDDHLIKPAGLDVIRALLR